MERRVLSIQSHVAHGFVGGRAAAFPLQVLGFDVDIVNTVNFSNHAGYRRVGGIRTSGSDLDAIFSGMEDNGLLNVSNLLTGYIPNADALSSIHRLVQKLKQINPSLTFLLDPVMGDSGRLYVAEDVIPIYRQLLPYSTIITPNWFEVETLVSFKLTSLQSLRDALHKLHQDFNVQNIVISSIPLAQSRVAWLPKTLSQMIERTISRKYLYDDIPLLCLCSARVDKAIKTPIIHTAVVPQLKGYYSGVGDLFSAMVLAHYRATTAPQEGSDVTALSNAASCALRITHGVLRRTALYASSLPDAELDNFTDDELDVLDTGRRARRCRARELRMVQSIDLILGRDGDGSDEANEVDCTMREWKGFWDT